jgi:hypothetical protein
MTSTKPDSGKTQVVSDSGDPVSTNGQPPELDDDDLAFGDDSPPEFPHWQEPGMRWDFVCHEEGRGTDYDEEDCKQVRGPLLNEAVNFDKTGKRYTVPPGREAVINAGQPNLARELEKRSFEFGGLVGRRVVIVYQGEFKSNKGRLYKSFKVGASHKFVTYSDLKAAES